MEALNLVNYVNQVQDPIAKSLYFVGQGQQASAAAAAAAEKKRQEEIAAQQRALIQAEITALGENPNARGADFHRVMSLAGPGYSESLKRQWDVLNSEQTQARLSHVSGVFSAFVEGRPDIAAELLKEEAVAKRNSGLEDEAKAADQMADLALSDPAKAKILAGVLFQSAPGADKVTKLWGDLEEDRRKKAQEQGVINKTDSETALNIARAEGEGVKTNKEKTETGMLATKFQLEQNKAKWDTENIKSIIADRTNRLIFDRAKLAQEAEQEIRRLSANSMAMTVDARNMINESTVASMKARMSAEKVGKLEKDFRNELVGSGRINEGGVLTKGSVMFANIFGAQGRPSALRMQWDALRNELIVNALPPGVATEKDIALISRGFPESSSDPAYLAEFMGAMERVLRAQAANSAAQAGWVNAVGSLGKARTDIDVEGERIPAGTSYFDFIAPYAKKKMADFDTEVKKRLAEDKFIPEATRTGLEGFIKK